MASDWMVASVATQQRTGAGPQHTVFFRRRRQSELPSNRPTLGQAERVLVHYSQAIVTEDLFQREAFPSKPTLKGWAQATYDRALIETQVP
ncbi:hypothetical protein DXG01_013827, partial [Tephrocybe rancida]